MDNNLNLNNLNLNNLNLNNLNEVEQELIKLYKEMAELTAPECAKCPNGTGRLAFSCCAPEYCQLAKSHARDLWSVELEDTPAYKEGKTNLPLLSSVGTNHETGQEQFKCLVEPHLRLACTVHTCVICSLGIKPGDPDWTTKYYKLRSQISCLEYQKYQLSGKTTSLKK